jgi:hypothetical protein
MAPAPASGGSSRLSDFNFLNSTGDQEQAFDNGAMPQQGPALSRPPPPLRPQGNPQWGTWNWIGATATGKAIYLMKGPIGDRTR